MYMLSDMHKIISKYVELQPQKIALQYKDKKYTYDQFYKKTLAIYQKLKKLGVKKGDIVAIYMNNSLELVISIYAILFIGAVVLPIDCTQPIERIEIILKDSGASFMLYRKESQQIVRKYSIESVLVDCDENVEIEEKTYIKLSPDEPAFCIYTSGSSGVPKGVLLYYKGILNHAQAKADLISISNKSKLCLSFNSGFVASIWQIIVPLLNGSELVIYDNNLLKTPYQLFEQIRDDEVTVVSLTPSLLCTLMEYYKIGREKIDLDHLEYIILTGEKLSGKVVEFFYKEYNDITLINAYGQTECSDDTFHYVIPKTFKGVNVPIGDPILNTTALILDENMQESQVGELYINSVGVTKGYLNNPQLTNIKFIKQATSDSVFYRTGDIVKKNNNNEYLYLGRVDNQIKLRGYRIEPEEIECHINHFPGIVQSVVRPIDIDHTTVALEVLYTSVHCIDSSELTKFLSTKLPTYMIPSKYTCVKEFNYLQNGKIDRNNLPETCQIPDKIEIKKNNCFSSIYRKAFEIIKKGIVGNLVQNISDETSLTSIGIDSITFIKIVISLEEEFAFEFDEEMLLCECFSNIGELIKYVEEKVK